MSILLAVFVIVVFLSSMIICGGAVWLVIKGHSIVIELRKPVGQRKSMAEIIRQVEVM